MLTCHSHGTLVVWEICSGGVYSIFKLYNLICSPNLFNNSIDQNWFSFHNIVKMDVHRGMKFWRCILPVQDYFFRMPRVSWENTKFACLFHELCKTIIMHIKVWMVAFVCSYQLCRQINNALAQASTNLSPAFQNCLFGTWNSINVQCALSTEVLGETWNWF